ncbi:MAG: phosphopentomutase [Candidatus Abyssobacteria bacterium SURF_17]|uniref:Phosphopentomutase n=1 Tax=Candidatus Abyssobacteria bacterium SURF_17 TaxID=2093361 RepID=A0A419EZU1_9BACT|nr:MAG: phosphopentomutase [Candidatus Abyssubacteria bacterium SURF_17]
MARAILIILDGVGCGALPDADRYGDADSNSLAHTAARCEGFALPNMERMGLGNIIPMESVPPVNEPTAHFGKMAEQSPGKDTTTGHWEMMGVTLTEPFPVFPDGFDRELIERFEKAVGRKVIGNKPASGTEIINELGPRQLQTGELIVYTSADSVFQIAAHQSVVPLEELYHICEVARSLLTGAYQVSRVIARPYIGQPGSFERTPDRRDFSVRPPAPTLLDEILDSGMEVQGVGKIDDIFAGTGFTECQHVDSNTHGIATIRQTMQRQFDGLLFANLVDFDMKYGHRNDVHGYGRALMEFDAAVPEYLALLGSEELLFITSDHGNDPTTFSTDHSREFVPLLVTFGHGTRGSNLGVRETFADVGATIAQFLHLTPLSVGTSFLASLS